MHPFERFAAKALSTVATALSLLVLCQNLRAAVDNDPVAPFLSSDTRKVYDLGGSWERIEDGIPVGTTRVPGDLGGTEPVRIRKTLKIDSTALSNHTWHLQLFGVVDAVELLVNGRFVMRYPGGMVPFGIRIREGVLRPGQNTVELLITPPSKLVMNIQRLSRSAVKQYLGVLREVFLVGTPHLWTESVRLRTSIQGGSGIVSVSARVMSGLIERLQGLRSSSDGLSNATMQFSLDLRIVDRASGFVVAASASQASIGRSRETSPTLSVNVPNVRLWSPASPNLYDLEIRLSTGGSVVDVFRLPFGFRSIRVATVDGARKLLLNDTVVRFHAVDYVEDAPGYGPTISKKQLEFDVSLMKTLGVDAIRVMHGSPHPTLLSLCDRYGIMVLADIPCADVPSNMIDEQELATRYRNAAERTVSFLDQHPSVIGFGLSDGLDERASSVMRYHQQMGQYLRRNSTKLLFKVISSDQIDQASEGGFDLIMVRFRSVSDSARLFSLQRRSGG